MLSLDDIEALLGPRPYKNEEVRNIDKFRFGLGGTKPSSSSDGEDSSQEKSDVVDPDTGAPSDSSRIVAT